jgi:alpha-D-ribose 1-methylphosphonate 5-triphosphate synthase subunit PhnG
MSNKAANGGAATRLSDEVEARRAAMALCAEASAGELAVALAAIGDPPEARDVRPVESGLVMLRGRMGGDGRPFNLGEASVTRAAVALPDGRLGFAWQIGRDKEKARSAAMLDALWQGEERDRVEAALGPVRRRLAEDRQLKAGQVAATKVNFFTMVRGED